MKTNNQNDKRNFNKDRRPKASEGRREAKKSPEKLSKDGEELKFNKENKGSFEKKSSFSSNKPRNFRNKFTKKTKKVVKDPNDTRIRLNKYLADAGIASRREADKLIEAGEVRVNGKIVTELGFKVELTDKVQFSGETIKAEKLRYVLLNKPKGYITTTDDPMDRKTVMTLIKDACKERIYPVGRLDRNTTGLLLFTNDGELAKKLTHPSHNIKKTYHAVLDKAFSNTDFNTLKLGITLDDGFVKIDDLQWASTKNKKEIGITIHSGRNRIVRRIFESFGYEVVKLDRVIFAGLTKKELLRGKWRFLEEKEIAFLKMLGKK